MGNQYYGAMGRLLSGPFDREVRNSSLLETRKCAVVSLFHIKWEFRAPTLTVRAPGKRFIMGMTNLQPVGLFTGRPQWERITTMGYRAHRILVNRLPRIVILPPGVPSQYETNDAMDDPFRGSRPEVREAAATTNRANLYTWSGRGSFGGCLPSPPPSPPDNGWH